MGRILDFCPAATLRAGVQGPLAQWSPTSNRSTACADHARTCSRDGVLIRNLIMAPKSKSQKDPKSVKLEQSKVDVADASLPSWPPIHPVLPATDLELRPLLADQILICPNLWTSTLCKSYVNFLGSLPLTTTPGKPKRGEAVRVNDRYQIDDAAFAERLWSETALKTLVEETAIDGRALSTEERRRLWGGDVLGLNSNIRIYRYSQGQFFDQHYDEFNNIKYPSSITPGAVPAKTTWTLLLYLTAKATGCEGGQTVFYPEAPSKRQAAPDPIIAELEVGMALLHRHGKDCLVHEGREVTAGEKWVIRSDLCVRR